MEDQQQQPNPVNLLRDYLSTRTPEELQAEWEQVADVAANTKTTLAEHIGQSQMEATETVTNQQTTPCISQ